MSITQAIFPGLAPDQTYNRLLTPVRSPKWNWKETMTWNNKRQQAVNGRVVVVKYWPNPLWKWEYTYGYVKDRTFEGNPFYTPLPVPATDFEILKGFYAGTQGGGNEFAYQTPDTLRGGSLEAVQVQPGPTSNSAILSILATGLIVPSQLKLSDTFYATGFTSTATFLNSKNLTVLQIYLQSPGASFFNILVSGSFTYSGGIVGGQTASLVGGQPLAAADANFNVELINTIGSYPSTLVGAPLMNLVTESVQLIDTSTLVVYDGVGGTPSFTLNQPSTVAPYTGYVMTFASAPTVPIRAAFQQYYLCRFSEDTQDYENFMSTVWLAKSVKFDQVRI